MNKLKLGKSVSAKSSNFFKVVREMAELGFSCVEFSLCDCGFFNREEELPELENRINFIKESNLTLSAIHVPYGSEWDISSLNNQTREFCVENVIKTIKWAEKFQPLCFVMHASFGVFSKEDRAKRVDSLIDAFNLIQSQTKIPVAFENLPETTLNTSNEVLYVAEKVKNFNLCFDCNHVLYEKVEDFLLKVGKKINVVNLHVSDHDYVAEKHVMPGEGKIEWRKVMNALIEIDYRGAFTYELRANITDNVEDIKYNYLKLLDESNYVK